MSKKSDFFEGFKYLFKYTGFAYKKKKQFYNELNQLSVWGKLGFYGSACILFGIGIVIGLLGT